MENLTLAVAKLRFEKPASAKLVPAQSQELWFPAWMPGNPKNSNMDVIPVPADMLW